MKVFGGRGHWVAVASPSVWPCPGTAQGNFLRRFFQKSDRLLPFRHASMGMRPRNPRWGRHVGQDKFVLVTSGRGDEAWPREAGRRVAGADPVSRRCHRGGGGLMGFAARKGAGFADFRRNGAAYGRGGGQRGLMVGKERAQEGKDRFQQPGQRIGGGVGVWRRYICFHWAVVS